MKIFKRKKIKDNKDEECIFRSAKMTLVQFYVTNELARDMVFRLGENGNVHFRDLNEKTQPYQRIFTNEIQKFEVYEKMIEFLSTVMTRYRSIKDDYFNQFEVNKEFLSQSKVDDIMIKISRSYEVIKNLDESYKKINNKRLSKIEYRFVINALLDFNDPGNNNDEIMRNFSNAKICYNEERLFLSDIENGNISDLEKQYSGFSTISGTIATVLIPILRKLLWRALRGNLYFTDFPISEKLPDFNSTNFDLINKNIFILYLHGQSIKKKVKKIIHSLNGLVYNDINYTVNTRANILTELNKEINDINKVLESTKNYLIVELLVFEKSYLSYCYLIKREKMIYEVLSKFDEDSTKSCLIGEAWIPKSKFHVIYSILKKLVENKTFLSSKISDELLDLSDKVSLKNSSNEKSNFYFANDKKEFTNEDSNSLIAIINELSTNITPPTYFKVNKFTLATQNIIDIYSIASYQEANPALPSIVTFPFVFAVMFGDLGHGLIVFLIGLYLIINEKNFSKIKNKNELFEIVLTGRYTIMLMGLFSIYTGFIYNDIFSLSFNLFKSGWKWEFPARQVFLNHDSLLLIAKKVQNYTYPFGIDPTWHKSQNYLIFMNSFKMKLSIIFGFFHMTYSLFLSLSNYLFYKSTIEIIGNFIPELIFLFTIIGYLCVTILYKWCVDWTKINKNPPGLLNMLIKMYLQPGKIDEEFYKGQKYVQLLLFGLTIISLPWILLVKPILLKKKNAKKNSFKYNYNKKKKLDDEKMPINSIEINDPTMNFDYITIDENPGSTHFIKQDDFNFGELIMFQIIHSIEYCLNCISHTASYLRLWALSLAHNQLSTVLWSMTMQNSFKMKGIKGIIFTLVYFAIWFILTILILVFMEGTSTMLHSLRIHWVESMSKFFKGGGYPFEPFTFELIKI